MNESTNQNTIEKQSNIDFIAMFKTLWDRRKVFYWVLPITFVLSSAIILCVPRRYSCKVILAPEFQHGEAGSSLQSMASAFGFDMGNLSSSDALYPMIYPDLVKSPNFLITLFDIPVSTIDKTFEGAYYSYLLEHQKSAFWVRWKNKIFALLKPKDKASSVANPNQGVDVFYLNNAQWKVITAMQENINCTIDKRTEVITFEVQAQDKLVCAIVADSVCAALQSFITEYRTQKARTDLTYYGEMLRKAYIEYQESSKDYITYIDGHSNIKLEQYRIEAKNYETEMDMKYSAYTSFQKQYLTTQARLQENTPVFTIIQSASIPIKPSAPRRMSFVIAMLILATGITCCVIWREQLLALILSNN